MTAPPAAPRVLAADSFTRSVTGGWGTADTGGAWTASGGASSASVAGGTGLLRLRDRVEAAAGSLDWRPESDGGWRVAATVPRTRGEG